ncbi:MAG: helix-turn-helix domain-containing protein [Candidatus Marinimicrobia bacterium]|nr:helix-turn-helix domain-containing protein [Candidatus Neomarinimicrobiota bacterium]MBL7023274.1 helix-turn-helix domain-containing protein [Candidatus Neomarinimicrobiota bacterium]MBL7108868.1 helix-turn-helix domain-containing protein [Candidatus Neomarinimicrobiota bacterium]
MTKTLPFFEELKAERKSRNIEISEISERTKINPRFLQAIEEGDFSVLPSVYMRLFLRSYAIEIGTDPKKALSDYELYTTGTITETQKQDSVEIEIEPKSESNFDDESGLSPSLSQKKILGIVALIIAIFSLFYFLNHLTEEMNTPSTEVNQQIQFDSEENTLSDSTEIISNSDGQQIDHLTESIFPNNNLIKQDSKRLHLSSPFSLQITANTPTVVHVKTNDLDFNGIMDTGKSRNFSFTDTLFFDLLRAEDVDVKINSVNLTPFLRLENDSAIRASIVSDGSLSVSYFSH